MENERLTYELDLARKKSISGNVDLEVKWSQSQLTLREKDRQLDLLNDSLGDKNRELEILRKKASSLEQTVLQYKSTQNENLTLKNKLENLEINIHQHGYSDKEKTNEINRLRTYERDNSLLQSKLVDVESRVKFLTTQNDKLNVLVGERAQEAKNWQSRLSDANSTAGRIPDLENKVRLLVVENEKLERDLYSQNDRIFESEKRVVTIPELESRIRLLATENERLQNILTDYCNKFNEFEGKASMATDLECRLKSLQGENNRQQRFIAELTNKLSEVEGRAQLLPSFEDKTKLLMNENERLQNLLEDVSRNYDESLIINKKIPEYEGRNSILKNENGRLAEAIVELKNQYCSATSELQDTHVKASNVPILEDKVRLLATENERLQGVLGDCKVQLDNQRAKLVEQDTRLIEIPAFENEIRVLRSRCIDLENHTRSLVTERDSAIIDHRRTNEEKTATTYAAHAKIAETEAYASERNTRVTGLETENNRLRTVLADTEYKLTESSKKCNLIPQLEGKVKLLIKENERLQEVVKSIEHLNNETTTKLMEERNKSSVIPEHVSRISQ